MNEEILEQINSFVNAYNVFEKQWFTHLQNREIRKVNFKRVRVRELDMSKTSGLEMMKIINEYRNLLALFNPSTFSVALATDGIRRNRVKEKLSISQKVEKFILREKDNPKRFSYVIKCLNDIFGARIIIQQINDFNELAEAIQKAVPYVRVTNACKDTGYKAVHVYTRPAAGSLPWELQIWQESDEEKNILLHAKYKQEYIREISAIREVNSNVSA